MGRGVSLVGPIRWIRSELFAAGIALFTFYVIWTVRLAGAVSVGLTRRSLMRIS